MKTEAVRAFLEPEWTQFSQLFSTAIASPYTLLTQANEHLLSHRGKQLRPMLTLLAAKLCGKPQPLSFVAAAVVEMVHTATLLHDDVADQSDTRRGLTTVQKLFSPSASVLLGDFWLARSFQVLMDHKGECLLKNFARAIREMSEGELFQIEKAVQRNTNIEEYNQIIAKKTAILITAGMLSGAESVGASQRQCALIEEISVQLGMAFQIKDDIFDYSPQLDTGKPSGQDLLEGKITLPLLGALQQAPPGERAEANHWMQALPDHPEYHSNILNFVARYEGVAFAQKELDKREKKAQELLSQFTDNPARRHLSDIISYLASRKE